MRKLFVGLVATVCITLTSFTTETKTMKTHDCHYRMYSNGQYIGNWIIYDVPGDVDCGTPFLLQMAIDTYNEHH